MWGGVHANGAKLMVSYAPRTPASNSTAMEPLGSCTSCEYALGPAWITCPALQLPPLDLASANIQPSGGVEDAPAEHRVLAASTTRRILQGDAGHIKVAPPSPSDAVVHRGIRRTGHGAHGRENDGWGAFSALEFLATAAEAQRVSSI